MAHVLMSRYPSFRVVGTDSPPYSPPTDDELIALATRIRLSDATIVWVGVGTPKQDFLVDRLSRQLSCPIVPVGAAFDFLAGNVKAAPEFLHGSGFEWLYRLLREPRRLWRRYTVGNARFVYALLRERVGGFPR